MKLTFAEFSQLKEPVPVVIHSLDQALYQITLEHQGKTYLLAENSGKIFRCHSLQQARSALQTLPVASLALRHQSAYDEMVGQAVREGDNALEVPLSVDEYPSPVIH